MRECILFRVGDNAYALDVETVERINPVAPLTPIPYAHPMIEGMMLYNQRSIKVVNFRTLTGMVSYEEELQNLWERARQYHTAWVEALSEAIWTGQIQPFREAEELCELSAWLQKYRTDEPELVAIVRELKFSHTVLHKKGSELLQRYDEERETVQKMLQEEIAPLYAQMDRALKALMERVKSVAAQFQKLLLCQGKEGIFALKVDEIDEIARIDDAQIRKFDHPTEIGSSLRTEGVIDYKGDLVIVIESVSLPGGTADQGK